MVSATWWTDTPVDWVLLAYRRKMALEGAPFSPETENLKKLSMVGDASARNVVTVPNFVSGLTLYT